MKRALAQESLAGHIYIRDVCDEAQGRRKAVEEGNMLNNECENLVHSHARVRFSWSRVMLNFSRPDDLQVYRMIAIVWTPRNQRQDNVDVGNASD